MDHGLDEVTMRFRDGREGQSSPVNKVQEPLD